ncbi:MAG: hypothetical protein IJO14_11705 [Clostridia bacterium]|nr:hypothetical protein [Clostridia bacterium]
MKKFLCLFIALLFIALCGCDQTAVNIADESEKPVLSSAKVSVSEKSSADFQYACDVCKGNCSFFTGRFVYPVLNADTPSATHMNNEIKTEFDKYFSMAQTAEKSNTGLAYGFTYDLFENGDFIAIRTNVATVMLHSGGSYSYSVYYYDVKKGAACDAATLCKDIGLDIDVIASFVRLKLAEEENYTKEQIAMIDASCIDVFPLDDSYFIKCKTDIVKYEAEIESADLNALAEEIQSEQVQFEEDAVARESMAAELASEVASEEAEESRLAAEEASREAAYEEQYNEYYRW